MEYSRCMSEIWSLLSLFWVNVAAPMTSQQTGTQTTSTWRDNDCSDNVPFWLSLPSLGQKASWGCGESAALEPAWRDRKKQRKCDYFNIIIFTLIVTLIFPCMYSTNMLLCVAVNIFLSRKYVNVNSAYYNVCVHLVTMETPSGGGGFLLSINWHSIRVNPEAE